MRQNPFSLYDFLGYLFPGATLLAGLVVLRRLTQHPDGWAALLVPFTLLGKVEYFVPLLLFAYVIGHIISYLSSVTVEKYAVWTLGYPSRFLLGRDPAPYFKLSVNEWPRLCGRVVVPALLFPIAVFELLAALFGFRPLYARPLDPSLRQCLRDKLNQFAVSRHNLSKVTTRADAEEFDAFRLAYHYALENAPNHVPKLQNYVALYGFARTLSLEATVFFWLSFALVCLGWLALPVALTLLSAAACVGFVLYLDFVKFYRKFSLEAMMAVLTTWGEA